jgi:hypothetical protein
MVDLDEGRDEGNGRVLRRVIPVAQVRSGELLKVAFLSIDDYATGFALRIELFPREGHPVREAAEARQREEEPFLREKAAEFHRTGADRRVAPMVAVSGEEVRSISWRPALPELVWTATDDRQNEYEPWQWGASGGITFPVESAFTPALDPESRRLVVATPEIAWKSIPPDKDESPVWVDPGPWIFRIDLGLGLAVTESTVAG